MNRLFVLLLAIPGCGESSPPLDGAPPAQGCPDRCKAKLEACGASPRDAADLCPSVCSASPTEAQMQCLEATSCAADLEQAMMECGLGPMSPGDAGVSIDAPPPIDAMGFCVEQGAVRYVCQCTPSLEVRGCVQPPDACIDLCPDEHCGNGAACVPE